MPERFLDRSLREFSDALSTHDPTPGGGSASAYTAALGAALAAMVGRLLLKRKDADVAQLGPLVALADELRGHFLRLVEDDSAAFDKVAVALRLPKETPAERARRTGELQSGLLGAAQVPLELAQSTRRLLALCEKLAERATSSSVSDAGVAAVLAEAALRGAALNVSINLAALKDAEQVKALSADLDRALEGAAEQRARILERVQPRIAG